MNETTRQSLSDVLCLVGREIVSINQANGWNVTRPSDWDTNPYKVPAVLMLIVTEVAEAVEAYRKGDRENFTEELADVFIRLLDLSTGLEIDLAQAVVDKMAKNRERAYRHGGKRL